jgi:magnesium-transporting ATPase (P-type)
MASAVAFRGLSADEARIRLRKYGANRLVRVDRTASLREFLRTVADPMALMLALASALYFWLGERHEGIVLAIALFPVLAVDVGVAAASVRNCTVACCTQCSPDRFLGLP